ncbi:WYL domain-containing protein [Flavihumibacter rivuli]|uniref:helix-turn-helix transcriptional regulator n=1 Tax=Flavihumibacter rivuli TaxID=2838156 RepID=UPI001BDEAD80|nr:WYL domain-containing protein [Flavihumibacter rivuli]ULQ55794.1 WYL domain-containing protein [Flavihumibacter rivuli]
MSLQGKIHQYKIIIDSLLHSKGRSRKQLMSALETAGFQLSPRTFERLLEGLRYEYKISIPYDAAKNCYRIDEDTLPQVADFMRFCKTGEVAAFGQTLMAEPAQALKHISFGNSSELKGIHWLDPLFRAITSQQQVSFRHENYHKGTFKEFVVEPYLLREYLYRWYLVGYTPDGELRTFGVDRIHDLKLLEQTFEPKKKFPYADLFNHVVGVTYDVDNPSEVILRVYPKQDKYLLSFPLHASQEVVKQTEDYTDFRYFVVPNYELIQRLLAMGTEVEVLEPKSLRKSVRAILKEAYQRYK